MHIRLTVLAVLLLVSSAFSQAIVRVNGIERNWAMQSQVIEILLRSGSRSKLQIAFDSVDSKVNCNKKSENSWLWLCTIPQDISAGAYFIKLFEDESVRSPTIEFNIINKSQSSIIYPFDRTIFNVKNDPERLPIMYLDENDNLLLPTNSRDEVKSHYESVVMRFDALSKQDRMKYRYLIHENTAKFNNLGQNFFAKFSGPEIIINKTEVNALKSNFAALMKDVPFYIMEIKDGRIPLDFKEPDKILPSASLSPDEAAEKNRELELKYMLYKSVRGIYPINFDYSSLKVDFDNIPLGCHKPLAEFSTDALGLGLYSVEDSVLSDAQPSPTSEPFTGAASDDAYKNDEIKYLISRQTDVENSLNNLMGAGRSKSVGRNSVDIFVLDTSRMSSGEQFDSFKRMISFNDQKYNIDKHGSLISGIIAEYSQKKNINIYQRQVCESEDCSLARTAQGICEAVLNRMSHSAHVIVNLSMTYVNRSIYMDSLLKSAVNRGVWFIVANGNADRFKNNPISANASGFVGRRQFPAYDSIRYNKMISVGGVLLDKNGKITNFFDNGVTAIPYDYEAQIYSPAIYLGDQSWDIPHLGTSYAVPYVTAALANLLTKLDYGCNITALKALDYISSANMIDDSSASNSLGAKSIQLVDYSSEFLSGSDIANLCN